MQPTPKSFARMKAIDQNLGEAAEIFGLGCPDGKARCTSRGWLRGRGMGVGWGRERRVHEEFTLRGLKRMVLTRREPSTLIT
jgi:hypothetical protein